MKEYTDAELDAMILAKRAKEAKMPKATELSDEDLDRMIEEKRAKEAAPKQQVVPRPAGEDAPIKAGLLSAADSALYGNLPRIKAGVMSAVGPEKYDDLYQKEVAELRALQEANPKASMAGELAGAFLGPDPFAKVKGVSALGKLGSAVARGGLSAAVTDDKDDDTDVGQAIAKGGILGGIIDVGAQGLGAAAKGTKKAAGYLSDIFSEKQLKASSPKVRAAAERLGIKPLRGMLEDNERLQKYESMLMQSPTEAGELMRGQRDNILKAMETKSMGYLPEQGVGAIDAGERIQQGLIGKNAPRLQRAEAIYQDFDKAYGKLPASEKQKEYLERQLDKSLLYRSGESSVGRVVSGMMPEIKNVSDLQKARTYVLAQTKNKQLDGDEKKLAREALRYFDRAIDNSIQGAARKTGGKAEAKQAMAGLGEARKLYRGVAEDLSGLSSLSGKKGKTVPDIIKNLDELEPAQLTKALETRTNFKALKQFAGKYPEEMQVVSQKIMTDIQDKAQKDGKLNMTRFVSEVKKIPKEIREVYFGKSFNQDFEDLKTLSESMPGKVFGPSGTPEGGLYQGMADVLTSPRKWLPNIREQALFENYQSKGGGLLGKTASTVDEFSKTIEKSDKIGKAMRKTRSALEKKIGEKAKE